jgi:hypothetical protein
MTKESVQTIERFVKIALDEISELQTQLSSIQQKQAAAEIEKQEELNASLKEAAQALYDSDFISDEYEKKKFMKRAAEDPCYLSSVIKKICQAADVSSFGSVAQVKTAGDNGDDPVMRKAFGYDVNYNLLDE